MLNQENKELCWQVLSKYGCENQMLMMIEECSELQKAICKIYRDNGKISDEHDANFREEMIDVVVMCQQMLLMTHTNMGEVNRQAKEKLERALK